MIKEGLQTFIVKVLRFDFISYVKMGVCLGCAIHFHFGLTVVSVPRKPLNGRIWTLMIGTNWLVVLGFNASLTDHIMRVGDAHVFPGFLTPVLTQLPFQSHRLLFSYASAEVRGENTPERKLASTGSQTHNHQIMSPNTLTTESR